jgi:hypothetical protein
MSGNSGASGDLRTTTDARMEPRPEPAREPGDLVNVDREEQKI